MNYWYCAQPNELFLDIDNVPRSIKHARARLQGAIECGKLDVAGVMYRVSHSKDHMHAIVTLKFQIEPMERFAWEVILHSDIYRACCNIMRENRKLPSPDILISPFPCFADFEETGSEPVENGIIINAVVKQIRHHDDKCGCSGKHNAAVMETCPTAKRLRGEFRNAGFFGLPSKNECTIWPWPLSEHPKAKK